MTTLVFDIETNGYLEDMDRVFSLVVRDLETGETWSCWPHDAQTADPVRHSIVFGLKKLMEADTLVGHNIISFDIPALQKVYPWFKPAAELHDTLIMGRLFWPDIKNNDAENRKRNPDYALPRKLTGSYKLEAFGYRLGVLKSHYTGGFDAWSEVMQMYCEQDVAVTDVLYRKCLVRWGRADFIRMLSSTSDVSIPADYLPYSDECVTLEHRVQAIIARQERRGFAFREAAAAELYSKLSARREELRLELQKVFKPFFRGVGSPKTPKSARALGGITFPGAPYQPVTLTDFNPGNHHHIIDRLQKVFGWVPVDFTDSGQPKVDDAVISRLTYPEAKLIAEYLMVQKRISQLAEGDAAWLRHVKNGRIHGGVITLGAYTRRMTHVEPNLAQVPSSSVPYGHDCRALFTASKGYLLLGCDADSLELRLLAGYMAPFDNGAYVDTVLRGDKSKGTDMHSVNCRALGMDPKQQYDVDGTMLSGREIAKTWFYAFIYGAGSEKCGWIMGYRGDPLNPKHWAVNKRTGLKEDLVAKKAGTKSKNDFMANLPALGQLVEQVRLRLLQRGFLLALDGGKLYARSPHSALNTLLQSAGAIAMKKALVILDDALQVEGFVPGDHYEFVANVHDEWQIEVKPEVKERVKQLAVQSIRDAGSAYNFACPLDGNAEEGSSWAETH